MKLFSVHLWGCLGEPMPNEGCGHRRITGWAIEIGLGKGRRDKAGKSLRCQLSWVGTWEDSGPFKDQERWVREPSICPVLGPFQNAPSSLPP